ncbi:MAG: hypothetical protein EA356_04905 [Geminicoccaceae bacterium]|nr:MAG: hypothetical protein EA356_04905 [Geminicoccaceae bacterium]
MLDHWLDLVVCALLVVTIAHLFLVQRRLAAFRAERDRLQAFVTALDLTVERAEVAIRRLKQVQSAGPEAAPAKAQTVRARTPEELLQAAAATQPRERRPAQPGAAAAVDTGGGKGGLAALLKSVAGQP